MVHELKSCESRDKALTWPLFQRLTLDYMSLLVEARKKTLTLSGTHAERLALTAELRTALEDEGN